MFCKVREAARIFFFALIILLFACPSTSNASSYTHTSYSDFIQGNGDGNIVFTGDGEIALSEQVGTAVGGFRLIGELPFFGGEAAIATGRGCLYAARKDDNHIYRATILEEGSISEWQATELAFGCRVFGGIAVVGDFIYVEVRGVVDYDTTIKFLYARLGADGGIGPWRQYAGYPAYGCLNIAWASGGIYVTEWPINSVGRLDIGPAGDLYNQQSVMGSRFVGYSSLNLLDGLIYVNNGTPLANIKYALLDQLGMPLWEKTAFPLQLGYSLVRPSTIAVGGCLLGFGGHDRYGAPWYMMNGVASMLDSNGEPQTRHGVASLPLGLASAGIAYWGDYIYVAGGSRYPSSWTKEIYAARAIEDGVPDPWTETSSMPVSLGCHQAVASDTHVYAISGRALGGPYTDRLWPGVLYAPILDSGELGDWTETVPLPDARLYHAAVFYGDSIYVAGGFGTGGTSQTTVWRSRVRPDGSLEAWETLTPLPEWVWGHSLVVHDNYLYCIYGAATEPMKWPTESPVYSAPILADGTLGDWTKASMLPKGLRLDVSAVVNGRLYVIGGEWLSKLVYSAPLAPNGGLGEWSRQTDLPCGTRCHSVAVFDGALYVMGGEMELFRAPQYYPSVYDLPGGYVSMRGTPDAAGNISEWEILAPTPYPSNTTTGLALSGNTLYFVGGYDSLRGIRSNKAFYSHMLTPETQLPTVSGGRYVGMFRLAQDEPMVSLHWSGDFGEGSGAKVRCRTAAQGDTVFGPWSEFSAANPLPIGQTASCLQYEVRLESANGNPAAVDSIRLVTDITPPTITIIPTPSVLWPANGKLVPVTINGSATDTESGVDHVEISVSDEYGLPCEQVTDFGQTTHLEASRRGDDPDGRIYIVRVTAVDRAGNESKAYALVVCPHDQGDIKKLPRRWQPK